LQGSLSAYYTKETKLDPTKANDTRTKQSELKQINTRNAKPDKTRKN